MEVEAIRVRADDADDLAQARASAQVAAVEYRDLRPPPPTGDFQRRVEPVSAILIGGAVVAVGKFVVDWWERRKGGLVIDLRPGSQDDLHRDTEVPFGYVVTFIADGKVSVDTKDMPKDAMERLLGEIVSGAFASAKAVAEAAGRAAGAGKVQTGGA